jgi:hypothetical protein
MILMLILMMLDIALTPLRRHYAIDAIDIADTDADIISFSMPPLYISAMLIRRYISP